MACKRDGVCFGVHDDAERRNRLRSRECVGGGSALEENPAATLAETVEGESQDVITTKVGEVALPTEGAGEDPAESDAVGSPAPVPSSVGAGLAPRDGEAPTEDSAQASGDGTLAASIPAAMERINEDVALTQPVAQQESTRSYFLAQTLESTKTVPIVSANLPLDKGTSTDVAEPEAEGEGNDSSETEGGEDSDEPDPGVISTEASDSERSGEISPASTVVGSFTYRGITYAVEPGGETVAVVAADYSKLPEPFIEEQTIVLPSEVTADGIDHYSVTRIADHAFASLTSEAASTSVISTEASESERSGEISDEEGTDEPAGITVLGIPASITSIGDDAFTGFDTLQYIVVEDSNPSYASYDGVLYNADQTCLLLVPEGRLGAVRVAPSVTEVKAEAFSHCSSVEAVVADPASAAYQLLEGSDLLVDKNIFVKSSDEVDRVLFEMPFISLAALDEPIVDELMPAAGFTNYGVSSYEIASTYNLGATEKLVKTNNSAYGQIQMWYVWNWAMTDYNYETGPLVNEHSLTTGYNIVSIGAQKQNDSDQILHIQITDADGNKVYHYGFRAVALPHHYLLGWSLNGTGNYGPNSDGSTNWFVSFQTLNSFTVTANFVDAPDYVVETTDTNKGKLRTTYTQNGAVDVIGDYAGIMTTGYKDWVMTLYANGEFDICIYGINGNGVRVLVYESKGAVAPNTGYEFAGWSASSGGSGASKANLSFSGQAGGGKVYYAHFTARSYVITWNANNGKWSDNTTSKSGSQTYGNALTLWGTNPSRDGYTFAGWYTDAANGSQVTAANTTVPASATTYYAHWTKNSIYTITLNSQLWVTSSSTYATCNATTVGTTAIYYWVGKGWFNTSSPADSATGATTSTALITAPTMNGYTYGGYWTGKTGITTQKIDGTKLKSTDAVTGNATWYAKWTKNDVYTITLNSQLWQYSYSGSPVCSATTAGTTAIYYWVGKGWFTSSSPSTSTSPATTTTNLITTPTLSGYKFEGYWNTKTGTGTQMTDGQKLKSVDAPTVSNMAATWYAKWTIDTVYTVTLDSQLWPSSSASTATCSATTTGTTKIYYWKGVGWYSSTKSYGANPTGAATTSTALITAPTLNGYGYGGYWTVKTGTTTQKIDGTALKSTDAVTADATWYAKWTKNSIYTITLNSQLWASSSAGSAASNATTTGTTAIYYWVGKGWYNISNPSATATAATTSTALITTPTLSGYTFKGYTTGKAGSGTPTMSDAGKLSSTNAPTVDSANKATWYAKWEIKSVYTVTLNSQLWATSSATNAVCNAASAGTTALYYWDGVGWFKTTKAYGDAPTGAASTSTTLVTPPTLAGYGFTCYRTEKAGNGDRKTSSAYLTSTDAISGDSTWYAEWTINPVYTVTLNSQLWASSSAGSSVCNATSAGTTALYYWKGVGWFNTSKAYGANPTGGATTATDLITTPSLNGYDFGGYWTGKTGATAQMTDGKRLKSTDAIDAGTTWYAKWTIRPVHTVTLNSQLWESASASMPKSDATAAGTTALYYWDGVGWFNTAKSQGANPTGAATTSSALVTTPVLTGYTFGGYYSGKAATGSQMTEGALLKSVDPIAAGTTWYAKWTINKHSVSWRYDGAKDMTDYTQNDVAYGSVFTLIEPGSKPGYKFTGWQASGADKASYPEGFSYTIPDGDVIFTATWSAHPYTKVVLSDPYLTEASAQGAVWYWPERGYVVSEDSKDVKDKGAHIVDVPNLKSLGYEFLGWFDDVNENANATKMIDENGDVYTENGPGTPADGEAVVWYAHWNRVSCPVDLMASYEPKVGESAFEIENPDEYLAKIQYAYFGKGFDESSVENGKIAEDLLPVRTGYTFMGYYTQKNAELSVADSKDQANYNGVQWVDANGNLSKNEWRETPAKRGSITLYAAWRLDDCEVTFDVRGNVKQNTEPVTMADQSSLDGTVWNYGKPKRDIPVPGTASFDRNGYTFGGWYYTESGDPFDEPIFVSDSKGTPTPEKWDVVKTSVTLYPAWTAKTYTLVFDDNFPKIAGVEDTGPSDEKTTTVAYDAPLDLSEFTPEFYPYSFKGWYTGADQLFEGTHMTTNPDGTKRFTPRGSYASMSEIELHALWSEPGQYDYTLFIKYPGTDEIVESVHKYYFTDTIKFDGTEAPQPVEGYRFEGWVEVPAYADAHTLLNAGGPFADDMTTDGFKPISTRDRFFVAKWSTRELSVSFSTTPVEVNESGESWIMNTDLLKDWEDKDGNKGDALSWSDACVLANQTGSDMSTGIAYDVNFEPFVLPNVVRKGQVFKGWKLEGSHDAPALGIVIDPAKQTADGMLDLVYIPVFEDALYTIVLDANTFGEEQRFEDVPYSAEFTFPYPATLSTGSVFVCWGEDDNTVSDGTEKFYPTDTVKLAPTYNEIGEMTAFGLAHLANDYNEIRLYAVWNNSNYHVDVPLFANLAIDTDRGDVIAGTNTIAPSKDNEDKTATYRIESVRYEPLKNDAGVYAFQREGSPTDKVYLSVYAGLNTGEATDLEHLLYADNIDKDGGTDGEVTYIDAKGDTAKAKPLLIELGGITPVVYGRTAPEGQASLENVTDKTGFVTFDIDNPLTIRYGLYFENEQTRKDFAFNGKYQWLLPKNDSGNTEVESIIPTDPNYGRRTAWSGNTVDVAKLHYTVSLVDATK